MRSYYAIHYISDEMVKSGILVLNPNSFMKPIICFIPDFPYAFPTNFTYGKRSIAPYLSTCFVLCVIYLCRETIWKEDLFWFRVSVSAWLAFAFRWRRKHRGWQVWWKRVLMSWQPESSETGKGHEQVCIFPVLLHHFPIMSSYYESVHVQLSSPHPRKGLSVSP